MFPEVLELRAPQTHFPSLPKGIKITHTLKCYLSKALLLKLCNCNFQVNIHFVHVMQTEFIAVRYGGEFNPGAVHNLFCIQVLFAV